MLPIIRRSILLLYLGAFYSEHTAAIPPVLQLPGIEGNVENHVTETQHTTCKIATDELVANARATVTRVLRGACNAKTMDERFENLEKRLIDELGEIKATIRDFLDQGHVSAFGGGSYRNQNNDPVLRKKNRSAFNEDEDPSPRQSEIDRLNNTVQEVTYLNGSAEAFHYYWRVENVPEMLANWERSRSLRSSSFHVQRGGYAVYLQFTPRYFPDGTVFVGVGLTRGRYDALLRWPFSHRIRLEILDHSPEQERQDRRSRIWNPSTLCTESFWGRPRLSGDPDNPICAGLSISRDTILSGRAKYLWNGAHEDSVHNSVEK